MNEWIDRSKRIIEAYVGEYASGKSEVAINRAVMLRNSGDLQDAEASGDLQDTEDSGDYRDSHDVKNSRDSSRDSKRDVWLVDFDLIEPAYTISSVAGVLRKKGIKVIGRGAEELFGVGEAGMRTTEEMLNALRNPGDIIIDVGHGPEGYDSLKLLRRIEETKVSKYAVVNGVRPMTSTVGRAVEFLSELGELDGLVNNTHLGPETDESIILSGIDLVDWIASAMSLPVIALCVEASLASRIEQVLRSMELPYPIWPIELYLKDSLLPLWK